VVLYFFEKTLALLSAGTRREARVVYVLLILGSIPRFVHSAITPGMDMPSLAGVSAALFFGLRSVERRRLGDVVYCALGVMLAVASRPEAIALVGLFVLGLVLLHRKDWKAVLLIFGILVPLGILYFVPVLTAEPRGMQMLQSWHCAEHLLRMDGPVTHPLPQALFAFYWLAHPVFFMPLPLFFLLHKRTDLLRFEQRLLGISAVVYLLFILGFPRQNLSDLLPPYFVILLLLFPAWDRMYAYGFYFLKKRWMLLIFAFFTLTILAGHVFLMMNFLGSS
jgi:hypothetical protein